jgi:hypothetical protein
MKDSDALARVVVDAEMVDVPKSAQCTARRFP